jgi:predicted nucleotidyltransferase
VDAGEDREYSRQPRPEDLVKICAALNAEGARYVLIGGFAVIARGLERPTKDIDLLIDGAPDNIERIKRALAVLPDNAVRDVRVDEIERYDVIRVADEVVVDLMTIACGVTWEEANRDSEILDLDGVEIPIAGLETLIRTKRTVRAHDAADREFLERLRPQHDV